MVWWKDVEDSSSFQQLPIRFQIPRCVSTEYGVGNFGSVTLNFENDDDIEEEFFDWWFKNIDDAIKPSLTKPFESNIDRENRTIRLKYVEGFTQVFDERGVYMLDGHSLKNCRVDILVEVSSAYDDFKGKSGLVCKIFQAKVFPIGCMFSNSC